MRYPGTEVARYVICRWLFHSLKQEGKAMLIKVMYKNNEYSMVKPFLLDDLIASGKITKFFRSEGWVTIGIDRIRISDYRYTGTERRKNSFFELLKWCRDEFIEKEI